MGPLTTANKTSWLSLRIRTDQSGPASPPHPRPCDEARACKRTILRCTSLAHDAVGWYHGRYLVASQGLCGAASGVRAWSCRNSRLKLTNKKRRKRAEALRSSVPARFFLCAASPHPLHNREAKRQTDTERQAGLGRRNNHRQRRRAKTSETDCGRNRVLDRTGYEVGARSMDSKKK